MLHILTLSQVKTELILLAFCFFALVAYLLFNMYAIARGLSFRYVCDREWQRAALRCTATLSVTARVFDAAAVVAAPHAVKGECLYCFVTPKDGQKIDESTVAQLKKAVLKKRNRIISKVKSKYWVRTHKYGIRIPKSVKEAQQLDRENGETRWWDAICKEMKNVLITFEEFDDKKKVKAKNLLLISSLLFFLFLVNIETLMVEKSLETQIIIITLVPSLDRKV